MKKALAIIASLLMLSPLTVSAEDEIEGALPLVRTTVYSTYARWSGRAEDVQN